METKEIFLNNFCIDTKYTLFVYFENNKIIYKVKWCTNKGVFVQEITKKEFDYLLKELENERV